jgi:hypothetical protein
MVCAPVTPGPFFREILPYSPVFYIIFSPVTKILRSLASSQALSLSGKKDMEWMMKGEYNTRVTGRLRK